MFLRNIANVLVAFVISLYILSNGNHQVYEEECGDISSKPTFQLDGKHIEIFKTPKVLKVRQGVYVAIGFSLGNSIMIEGVDGIIIVDTTESGKAMLRILSEFRKLSPKPLKAVILTHFHADHIEGTRSLLDKEGWDGVDIYAHVTLPDEVFADPNVDTAAGYRGIRQFGLAIKKDNLVGAGIGYSLEIEPNNYTRWKSVRPTILHNGRKEYTAAGLTFELIHTPGETPDQISVWFPSLKAYLPADNIYQCFPNLYAIRGSPARDVKDWYESLDVARELRPTYLVPSHNNPIIGEDEVYDTLTVYRDAIKFIHDQTVRYINKGWHPDEIANYLKLPSSIVNHPFLHEYYGTVEWSIRTVFDQYLGWFSGDPVDLNPLTTKKRAYRMALLLSSRDQDDSNDANIESGISKMLKDAEKSINKSKTHLAANGHPLCDEDQWAIEICRYITSITEKGTQQHTLAINLKVKALYSLYLCSPSANSRHYLLTSALEEQGKLNLKPSQERICLVGKNADLSTLLQYLALRLDDKKCEGYNATAIYKFNDNPEKFRTIAVNIRNCVCDIIENPPKQLVSSATLIMSMNSKYLRGMFCGTQSGISAYLSGEFLIEQGGISDLKWFMNFFDKA